jgi:hypothetical protein
MTTMAKTLKDFLNEKQLGPMVVKNPDEQKFIDKHVVAKTADRNGNDDELFKGSKVKMIDRKKERKGYNPGEDEEVYEELKGNQHKIDANKNGKVDAHDFHLLRKKKKVAEEAEELEELSHATLRGYRMKAKSIADNEGGKDRSQGRELAGRKSYGDMIGGVKKPKVMAKEEADQIDELSEPTVRTYYNKAGEQGKKIADKMKMGGGDWSKDGSDTKTLKKRAAGRTMALKRRSGEMKMSEDAEQIDEISAEKKDAYAQKAGKQLRGLFAKSNTADGARKYYNRKNAVRKIANEEVEQVDEKLDMKKASMGTVVKDFQKSDAPQFMGKSQKKRQVMAVAAKLSAERGGKPLNKEERLLTKLADLAETHQRTMVSVFEKLNEDNQHAFMQACDTADGIEQMLDFSISYRGE